MRKVFSFLGLLIQLLAPAQEIEAVDSIDVETGVIRLVLIR